MAILSNRLGTAEKDVLSISSPSIPNKGIIEHFLAVIVTAVLKKDPDFFAAKVFCRLTVLKVRPLLTK